MKVVLELQDQPSNIKKVTIRHDIVIGRGADCNLRLSAPQVSRRHCFLRIGTDGAFVSDLESSNGTFLNGTRLSSGQRFELEDGAILAVGPVKFVTRILSEVPADDMLQVNISEGIEAEHSENGTTADGAISGTHANPARPGSDDTSMKFAIEHAGESSSGDEPTADYVSADSSTPNLFATDDDFLLNSNLDSNASLPSMPVGDDSEPDTIAATNDALQDLITLDATEDDPTQSSEESGPAKIEDGDMESDLRSFLSGLE